MPFTPTHVAAVLPIAWLVRWRLPFSALAIGSMVCDLGVFFPGIFNYWTMHSISGILSHCLPLGLLLYFIFHWVVKRPLCGLLPDNIALRLIPWINYKPTVQPLDLIAVASCLVFGAFTHILWDSFTHYQRWGTKTFPVLNGVAFELSGKTVYWYTLLQHGSSVVFLPPMMLAALIWVLKQEKGSLDDVPRIPKVIKALTLLGIIVVPMLTFAYYYFGYPYAPFRIVIHEAVKMAGTIVIVCGLLYGLAFTVLSKNGFQARALERKS